MKACYLVILLVSVCAGEFMFGGSVDPSRPWPLCFDVIPSIHFNSNQQDVSRRSNGDTLFFGSKQEAPVVLVPYFDPQSQNLIAAALDFIGAKQYILVEKEGEFVDQFVIPPTPYASLWRSIPLDGENVSPLVLESGFYRFSLSAFHCRSVNGYEQCSPVVGYPIQRTLININHEIPSMTFQKTLEQKIEEKQEEMIRDDTLASIYLPHRLHPEIFSFDQSFIDHSLLSFLQGDNTGFGLQEVISPVTETGIYQLRIFTPEFCQKLIEEVDHYESFLVSNKIDPNAHRPNFLNKFGIILDEMGLGDFLQTFMKESLEQLTSTLFYEWGGDQLDSHHGFVVEYQISEKDVDLEYHLDQAEVTLNVSLGKEFEGGSVFFNGVRDHPSNEGFSKEAFDFQHVPGSALLHIGQHWHGANKIQSGERYNLILWMRSSHYHQSIAEQFWNKQNLQPSSETISIWPDIGILDIE